jgi:nitrogen fixation NifU-like protein
MSDSLQQLYQQIILDHSKTRHGATTDEWVALADETAPHPAGSHTAESHQVNTTCGDEVTVRVTLDDNGTVTDYVWRGNGCSISMASASVAHDTMRLTDTGVTKPGVGVSVADAHMFIDTFRDMLRSRGAIEPDEEVMGDAAAFAGVSKYPARVKCAMLPWVALEAALLELESK